MEGRETTRTGRQPGGRGGPLVTSGSVLFRFVESSPDLRSVSLVQEVAWPREGPRLAKGVGGLWTTRFERPPVDRMEYRFELDHGDGGSTLVLDPANAMTAPGAFGERSVIEFPEYVAPSWIGGRMAAEVVPAGERTAGERTAGERTAGERTAGERTAGERTAGERTAGERTELVLPSASLGSELPAILWSSPGSGPDDPLPLLIALDGLEFSHFSQLDTMLDVLFLAGELPPMRALLLHPVKRDEEYTANPAFADALEAELLPELATMVAMPTATRSRVGLGASLGGLALVHAHTERPELFGGLYLQSSSFLHGRKLPAGPLGRITKFVDDLIARSLRPAPVKVVMTCGTVEQNLANNREILAVLCEQGYPAELHVVRDAHNWIAWRDAWTPWLPAMLRQLWA